MSQFILRRLLPISQFRTFSSSKAAKSVYRSSFTVNYLINSCGLTPERALSVSKRVNFAKADTPNSVLAFFKDQGFTQTQVSKIVHCYPSSLLCDPARIFLPKFEFLKSRGMSGSEAVALVSRAPTILGMSLENHLIRSFNFFSICLNSEKKANYTFKRFLTFPVSVFENAEPNFKILIKTGVPVKNIGCLVSHNPQSLLSSHDKFTNVMEEVKKMGFNPSKVNFVIAIHALYSMKKATWERKIEIYKQWSWSEDDIFSAFRKQPRCMTVSESKITLLMEFWVNKMGLQPSSLADTPDILSFSLEKRIIPRCIIYQALVSKGLQKPGDICLTTMIKYSEKYFLERALAVMRMMLLSY